MVRFSYTNPEDLVLDFEYLCARDIPATIQQPSQIVVDTENSIRALKALTVSRCPRYRTAVITSEKIQRKIREHGVPLDKPCIGCQDLLLSGGKNDG